MNTKPIYRKYVTRVLLAWGGCLVVCAVVYAAVLGPQKARRAALAQQLAQNKQIYETAMSAARTETQSKWNEQMEALEGKLRDFAAEDSANLTFDISQIAREKQAYSFSIRAKDSGMESKAPDCEHIGENYVHVNFSAGFREFATLLNALERHRPVIFIDKFTITRSKKGETHHPVDMELAVFVLKRPDGAAAEMI
jgi:hypothetical protein